MMFEKDMSANIAMDELGIEKEEREAYITMLLNGNKEMQETT